MLSKWIYMFISIRYKVWAKWIKEESENKNKCSFLLSLEVFNL